MKKALLASLWVAGALTACGGGSDDTPPPDFAGAGQRQ